MPSVYFPTKRDRGKMLLKAGKLATLNVYGARWYLHTFPFIIHLNFSSRIMLNVACSERLEHHHDDYNKKFP